MVKKYWLEILAAIAILSATYLLPSVLTKSQTLGTSIPVTPALIDTYLASGISSTDTSLSLASGVTRSGSSLSGTMCFVIDVNQPTVEYVCGTASSTSVTSLTRGIDPLNPNSSSTALAYSHRRFASVQVTDYPTIQFMQRQLTGVDGISNVLKYATSTVSTSTIGYDPGNLVNVAYVSDVAVTGCANGSTSVRGCFELSTSAEAASSTATGGTGAALVPPNSLVSETPTASKILFSNSSGKLAQGWLNLTEAFSWSGTQTFTGSATHNATTTLASSTIFSSLSSGLLYGNGTSSVTSITPGTSGQLLISNGSSWAAGNISHATSSISATTLTGSTSTLMITVNHGTNATVILNCGAAMTAANQTVNFGLRSSPGSGTLDSCSLGSGTGAPGGCALNAIVTPSPSATSSSYYINNSNANNGVGSCIGYSL